MSPNTLTIAKQIANSLQLLNPDQTEKLLHLLTLYEPDTYLHPASLMNKLDISAETAYLILTEMVKNRLLEINFQYYCYTCQTFIASVYRHMQTAPELLDCEDCDRELTREQNIVVIYRVISA